MNRVRRAACLLSLSVSLLLLPCGHAWARGGKKDSPAVQAAPAQDMCGPEVSDPQQLAREGLRLYNSAYATASSDKEAGSKLYERSLRCYQAALRASHDQKLAAKLYHPIGLVYEKLSRYVEAVEAFKSFLAEVPEERRLVGVTTQVTEKLGALRKHVAELDIDTLPGLEVRVDERAVGKSPLMRMVVVPPGSHSVTVGSPEVGTLGANITVEAGQVKRVDLSGWRPRDERPPVPVAKAEGGHLLLRSNRDRVKVLVDGSDVGVLPLPELDLDPGTRRVVGRSGSQERVMSVVLRPREHAVLDLHFPPQRWVYVVAALASAAVLGTAVGVGVYYGTSVNRPDMVLRFP